MGAIRGGWGGERTEGMSTESMTGCRPAVMDWDELGFRTRILMGLPRVLDASDTICMVRETEAEMQSREYNKSPRGLGCVR